MRGDTVYRIYGVHAGREKDNFFGAFRTVAEAEAEIARLQTVEMHGKNWAETYHDQGFFIRSVTVETDFEIPPLPKPRDKYFVRTSSKPNRPGTWASTIVEVFGRGSSAGEEHAICRYERSYSMLQTFEPFRQVGRDFALISRDYTKTAVLDLGTGEVIAEEPETYYGGNPAMPGGGFCPVGFYVPDWWDVHRGHVIPGSEQWGPEYEWPVGDFGFVWGCQWGDDSSWKVQYLDLSRVRKGVIARDDRFGYIELATAGYRSPCIDPESLTPETPSAPPAFITVESDDERRRVTFAVEMRFDLRSGACDEWERKTISDLE